MYNSSLTFNSVILVESLSDGDLKTGRDLFETVMAPANFHDPSFLAELYTAHSSADLLGILRHVEELVRTRGLRPILHLEMHGSEAGIRMANGDRLAWRDIAQSLARINRLTEMNLLVVAALCHGWFMIDILRPIDRAPAFGIVGTANDIGGGALLEGMQRFYEVLLRPPHDLGRALVSANIGRLGDDRFRMINAELMLCRIYSHYVEEHTSGHAREARVNQLVAALAPSHDYDVTSTMALRQQIRSELDNHPKWFDHYRQKFLWLDEMPGNAARFRLSYEGCQGLAGGAAAG